MPKTKPRIETSSAVPKESSVIARPLPTVLSKDGRIRAVIDAVLPSVDGGRFPVKRIAGASVKITAHCFADGHDVLRVVLQWRPLDGEESTAKRHEIPMVARGNDVWDAEFTPPTPGRYAYTVAAWVDPFDSWRHELMRRVDADDIRVAVQVGAMEIVAASGRAESADRTDLAEWAALLRQSATGKVEDTSEPVANAASAVSADTLKTLALDEEMAVVMARYPDRQFEVRYAVELPLIAERARAGFSTWYELFPRSAAGEPGIHGTFKDVEARLPAIAAMGFDVLYFPPIHPIGFVNRKGRNNSLVTEPGDAGSPWAIGAAEGGHKAILPALGTAQDFRHLVATAASHGIEIALDIAFQCAPDHPWVKAHPDCFAGAPMVLSSTPRTRRRSTKTSTRSISRATTGARCGPN